MKSPSPHNDLLENALQMMRAAVRELVLAISGRDKNEDENGEDGFQSREFQQESRLHDKLERLYPNRSHFGADYPNGRLQ